MTAGEFLLDTLKEVALFLGLHYAIGGGKQPSGEPKNIAQALGRTIAQATILVGPQRKKGDEAVYRTIKGRLSLGLQRNLDKLFADERMTQEFRDAFRWTVAQMAAIVGKDETVQALKTFAELETINEMFQSASQDGLLTPEEPNQLIKLLDWAKQAINQLNGDIQKSEQSAKATHWSAQLLEKAKDWAERPLNEKQGGIK